MRAYEYRHTVGFDETNLVGNVYFANHLRWQGRCREMFLCEHAPDVLERLTRDLALVTVRCSCEYLAELSAFDALSVRMRLSDRTHNKVDLDFEYWRTRAGSAPELVARGAQTVACMRRGGKGLEPAPLPASLARALEAYAADD